ncbi:MAG: septation protein SepH [Corynebacterium sp.]|uniref:septation protein SepH n=1 Tax=Corynebacterium sp. TaxID=1720 RepID=UPI0026DBC9F0|nr:septation protein SepH [Corynebacterium sp.]MDO5097348.1 septation protein SepH [Corynebacterium sp.]
MQELFLVPAESTARSLVLRTEDDQQFFLVVTDELRSALVEQEPKHSYSPAHALKDDEESTTDSHVGLGLSSVQTEDSGTASQSPIDSITPLQPMTPLAEIGDTATAREVDPRLSAPLKMTPREIQERIRAGASVADIAELNDVPASRIESYAHPVLLERARLADLAKRAHPVRDDGPAKLTLWEILATAFAARGLDLSTTHWDTYRDGAGQWVVTVNWTVGVSDNVAEWSYHRHGTSSATAVARNSLAADLIDPDFVQPVRSLTAVTSPIPVVRDEDLPEDFHEESERPPAPPAQETTGEDLVQHPPPQTKRRRKAVTPHWEDVLLGVRTSTKRPRK